MIEFLMGIILGIIFFGGLYWTVQKLGAVKHPSVLITISFFIRTVLLLAGLFYVAQDGFQGIIFALVGIIFVRFALIFMTKNPKQNM